MVSNYWEYSKKEERFLNLSNPLTKSRDYFLMPNGILTARMLF